MMNFRINKVYKEREENLKRQINKYQNNMIFLKNQMCYVVFVNQYVIVKRKYVKFVKKSIVINVHKNYSLYIIDMFKDVIYVIINY